MTVVGTNQVKNNVSPTGQSRSGFYLLMEDGFLLQQEDEGYIILDQTNYGVSGTNQSKNNVSPTGQLKS